MNEQIEQICAKTAGTELQIARLRQDLQNLRQAVGVLSDAQGNKLRTLEDR